MINSFTGKYRFLSNFYPCLVQYNGITFPSVEHAYQAQKTTLVSEQLMIAKLKTPGQAKRMGREVKCRPDWEVVKVPIMRDLEMFKYGHQELLEMLLATDDEELVEGNWWHDQFWGDCICPKHKDIPGANNLGKLLMEVRETYRRAHSLTVAECEIGED